MYMMQFLRRLPPILVIRNGDVAILMCIVCCALQRKCVLQDGRCSVVAVISSPLRPVPGIKAEKTAETEEQIWPL